MHRFISTTFGVICCGVVSVIAAQDNVRDDAVAKDIQKLIPAASGMSLETIQVMARSEAVPELGKFDDQPLSLVLLLNPPGERTKERDAEFRFLKKAPRPSELFGELSRNVPGTRIPAVPYATFVHANRITKVTAGVTGSDARGKVEFRAPDLYEGAIDYAAVNKDGKWVVTEFHMPAHGWSVVLDKEGRWKATQKATKENSEAKR
jgi:hypothetical protein